MRDYIFGISYILVLIGAALSISALPALIVLNITPGMVGG